MARTDKYKGEVIQDLIKVAQMVVQSEELLEQVPDETDKEQHAWWTEVVRMRAETVCLAMEALATIKES